MDVTCRLVYNNFTYEYVLYMLKPFACRKVTLTVENIIQHRDVSNIIAVIKGHFETGN